MEREKLENLTLCLICSEFHSAEKKWRDLRQNLHIIKDMRIFVAEQINVL